jgi:N6-L-threonylcarbamoyladenine synthase
MRESVHLRRKELAQHPEWGARSEEAAALCDSETLNLIASFQHAVVGNLLRQSFAAAETFGARGIVVSGGVAANSELRRRFQAEADRRGLPVAFPSLALSTDNAAMIAAAAWPKFVAGEFAPDTLGATPQLRLG